MTRFARPVFYDPYGRRQRRLRRLWLALAAVGTLLAAAFIISVLVNPVLPRLELRPVKSLPQPQDVSLKAPPLVTTRRKAQAVAAAQQLKRAWQKHPHIMRAVQPVGRLSLPPQGTTAASAPLAIAFYVNWDDSSYASLKRNIAELDWLVPAWFRLDEAGGDDVIRVESDPRVIDLVRRQERSPLVLPLVQNAHDDRWDGESLARAVASETTRQRLVQSLARHVEELGAGGVVLDFEEVPSSAQADLLRFVRALHEAFRVRGWIVAEAVPFDNPDWNYPAYGAATDYLMLMAYDEHWSTGAPGPVASQAWFMRTLAKRMAQLDAAHTVVCIGNYGYDWSGKEAADVTFQEAVLAARDSEATIAFDRASLNPHFSYEEEDGSAHTVWFLDAVTAFNQMRAAGAYHPAGFAVWRLGSEDPSLWNIFGRTKGGGVAAEALRTIHYGYDIDFEGTGEILQLEAEPHDGRRQLQVDEATGLVTDESYEEIPSSYVIRRTGDHPGLVALTFDDGPDEKWTPRILDILRDEGVRATFFIIGENRQAHPDLVRRIVQEGHDIGNHTYTHPNLGETPRRLTELELTATERLIEALTGHATLLFRPPYFGDAEPTTPDEIEPIAVAQRLGYITVGLRVDPEDWKLTDDDGRRRTADDIVRQTMQGVSSTDPERRGQVVLLHDGGGNRAATVQALPAIIHELRARGYRFVTVSELAGLKPEQTMPPVAERHDPLAYADRAMFVLFAIGGWALRWLFVLGIVLGSAWVVWC